jgi:pyruvate dehydrogenase E2 component (dihydrolipoamide acetyltransferase)
MVHTILMPKPGQMTEECVLVAWHKREGDPVARGDVLFEIETDKAVMDVEAFDEGVLLKRCVEEGQTVPVNTVCAYVGEPGEAIPEDARAAGSVAAGATPEVAAAATSATVPTAVGSTAPPSAAAAPQRLSGERLRISPRASRLAAEAGLDPRTLLGSGPDARILERDVRAAIAARDAGVAVGPATGPALTGAGSPPAPEAETDEAVRPLSRMRRTIAQRLTQSWTSTPHFTVTVGVDMSAVLALRQELAIGSSALSVTDFVLLATARSLAEFPDVNSRTDGTSVWPRRRVHLGLAVALPAGLVVPVIRDADRCTLRELHERSAALVQAARDGTLAPDEMTGSTFTVSNLGMFGVDEFSAIINPGEAAILAVASAVATPVAIGEGLAVRPVMKLTLSADHRLVDGEMAARFLNAVRRRLEDAAALRNDVFSA